MIISELPTDIASRILGEYLSQKGLAQLDNAICCKQREKYLQLLTLVQFFPQFIVDGKSTNWIWARQIRLLSLKLQSVAIDVNINSATMLPSLQSLCVCIHDRVELEPWLTTIASHCPRLQTLQLQGSVEHLAGDFKVGALLNQCPELKHFHVFKIRFPPNVWKELFDQQVSFLSVTTLRYNFPIIRIATGPLPTAFMSENATDDCEYKCIWNMMQIPHVNAQFSTFCPDMRVVTVCYDELCMGVHYSMFESTFRALKHLRLRNCVDMDEHTFAILLELPHLRFIELCNNHTVRNLVSKNEGFWASIHIVALWNFSALENDTVELMKQKMIPGSHMFCFDMPHICFDYVAI